ncbi:MAG: hypothetical protein SOY12_07520 [Schaedlerella sp.]|nr:hypothetical protein [Lachnospiraceae bacterium]MDY4202868.1 hypothetical protein [Schaedlerella sp.]
MDRRRSADRIIMALRIIAVLSFVLLAMIAAAAGAYLADGDRQENRFSVGNNKLIIDETYEIVEPGSKTVKKPQAENTGKGDCYVRGRVILSDSRAEEYLEYYMGESSGMNTTDWKIGEDGWFYYQNILKTGEKTSPVFTHIQLQENIPDMLKDFTIDVLFESVQSEGFADAHEAFIAAAGE